MVPYISLPLYDNVNCKDSSHINANECLYTDITEALVIRKEGQIAGWMEY